MNTQQLTMQLVQVLEKTVSPEKNELAEAVNFLEKAAENNLLEYIKLLSNILATTSNSQVSRMAAGLQLKNNLTSKKESTNIEYKQRWLQFPDDDKEYIKENILRALGTENSRPSTAAQCVAYVAIIELPLNRWPKLIGTLVLKAVSEHSSETNREAALEAIGYICQEINEGVLDEQSNQILTAIIYCMRRDEPNNRVRLAATTALYNSLEFTKANFERDNERNYLMEVVCEATQSSDTQITVAALKCIVKILSLYYEYMEPYMGQALFPITLNAMKSDNEQIALQGIEFWSTVCDEELILLNESQEVPYANSSQVRVSKEYALGALAHLMPVLLDKLTQQDECEVEDSWSPTKAASVCLMLLATCCENDILDHVLPFIGTNIKSSDWRYRNAAVMCCGALISGLKSEILKRLAELAMPTLIHLMQDPNAIVRDTTAWTFGKICEYIPEAVISSTYLGGLLECLVSALKSEPRVAANACWALVGLANGAYSAENTANDPPETYCLSPYVSHIIQQLLETTERTDGVQVNLRGAAYEAIMHIMKSSPNDCYDVVQNTTITILERINNVLQLESVSQMSNKDDFNQLADVQSLLCATLQSVLRKVHAEDGPKISDAIMIALLKILNSHAAKTGTVLEDVFSTITTLVELLGTGFIKYMEAFKPYLYMALKNFPDYKICCAAIGLTGDICRALKYLILPYCDEIMTMLLSNLHEPSLHRSAKPLVLSVFGDMALSIGSNFVKYLDIVLHMLQTASVVQVDPSNYDMVEYLNELRESVLESYTGIVQGLKGTDLESKQDVKLLEPHLEHIISLIQIIALEGNTNPSMIACAAGLIGDLCTTFGPRLIARIDYEVIKKFLTDGKHCGNKRARSLCVWALKILKKLRFQTGSPEND